jgi:hypothetical protein
MSLNTDTPWLWTVVGTVRVPYIQNLVQFVRDAAYLYFIYTYPRISPNTEHAKKLQKTDSRPKRYVTNQFIVLYEKL